jgi:hypothetical protein
MPYSTSFKLSNFCHTQQRHLTSPQGFLACFHQNKDIFFNDLGICEHFNFPKLHSLLHYQLLITLFGTTDNYDTERTKQLHINFTKNCFCATNHKDKYPQMTAWVECCEKVEQHVLFIAWWQQAQQQGEEYSTPIGTPVPAPCALQMT